MPQHKSSHIMRISEDLGWLVAVFGLGKKDRSWS